MSAIASPISVSAASQSFRRYFTELREAFLEREALFTQIELALLCREHVLVVGPPGTAKSAIASAVLSRILDDKTEQPSLFAKQLTESTVQTDLIGPVDFKVLTETGRTEYLTEDGMLGATFAFLDEVFDGRDMLLRSILNVLHERELKHGKRLTEGRIECALMTSNRYLSEVLARSPELLLAFADRLSFISFVPKSFARRASRGAMLLRSAKEKTPSLRSTLSLAHLAHLQQQVEEVTVPSVILEGLELLADELERVLQQQVSRLPDYVPTKYFSQRTMVKALWALKAAVVRDRIFRRPERALVADERDLDHLRSFFLLGGPNEEETVALLKGAVDPRERAQLEILRMEHKAFDEALAKAKQELMGGVEREAAALQAGKEMSAAEALGKNFQPAVAADLAKGLRVKLVPGPRHPQNRIPLLAAARMLVAALESRLGRGTGGSGEGRSGVTVLASCSEIVELCRTTPELSERVPKLSARIAEYGDQSLEMLLASAEGAEFDEGLRLDGLFSLTVNLEEEFTYVRDAAEYLASLDATLEPGLGERAALARERVAQTLRRRATATFHRALRQGDTFDALAAESRKLSQFEQVLTALSPGHAGLRQELLAPLGKSYLRQQLATAPFTRIDQFARAVTQGVEALRREGVDPVPALAEGREVLESRLKAHALTLAQGLRSLPAQPAVLNGEAYALYRERYSGTGVPDGELSALLGLEAFLVGLQPGSGGFSAQVRESVASAELSSLHHRVTFLRAWLAQIVTTLPKPEEIKERPEAERAFDRLVKTRFPLLAMKEGELVRLQASLAVLIKQGGEVGAQARKLDEMLSTLSNTFSVYSKKLLEIRAHL